MIYLLLLVAVATFIFTSLARGRDKLPEIPIGTVAAEAKQGVIDRITVNGDELTITYQPGYSERDAAVSRKEKDVGVVETLRDLGVSPEQIAAIDIKFMPSSRWENWGAILGTLLPLVLVGFFFFFLMRQAQGAGNQAFSFGKSRARLFTGDKPTVTFDDVAGAEEAKEELQE
ncbi:MAG TPA: cell division protein FtsH, partial [Anaerolineae bacterium]|nr:cell division protein FtsH [Anaerolineae bacterium]